MPETKSLAQFLGELPVIGYLLKVGHDLIKLPVVRRDLHNEILLLQKTAAQLQEAAAQREAQAEQERAALREALTQGEGLRATGALLEQHLSSLMEHLSNMAAAIHSLEERGSRAAEQLQAVEQRVAMLQDETKGFPAGLRHVRRYAEEISRRLAELAGRSDSLPPPAEFAALTGLVAGQEAKIGLLQQQFSSILDQLSQLETRLAAPANGNLPNGSSGPSVFLAENAPGISRECAVNTEKP